MLGITLEQVKSLKGDFQFVVEEIKHLDPHEIEQNLFDKIYPQGEVNSESEFRSKIEKDLEGHFDRDAEWVFRRRFVTDIMDYMSVAKERHVEVGTVAAKYVETLQRSNEQLVKLVGIMHKKTSSDTGLSLRDKEDLFDMIQENKENVE